jgi:hypothetical protein
MQRTVRLVALALAGPALLLVGALWVLLWFIAPLAASIVGAASVLGVLWLVDAGNRAVAQRQANDLAAAVARLNREA